MKTINSGPAEWGPVKPQTGLFYGNGVGLMKPTY